MPKVTQLVNGGGTVWTVIESTLANGCCVDRHTQSEVCYSSVYRVENLEGEEFGGVKNNLEVQSELLQKDKRHSSFLKLVCWLAGAPGD